MKTIPAKIYNKMTSILPIACVDICLVNANDQILFVKRDQEPAKEEWWLPGGRIHIGETIEEAAIRKAKEEVNIDISDRNIHRFHFGETIFKNKKGKIIRHSLNAVVWVLIKSEQIKNIRIDKTSSDWNWHNNLEDRITHPYLFDCIRKALR